ncbi:MAG: hypothetical protein Q8N75_05160, partial [Pseudomonadota bacterium]|nr:hypothetical protein [Pseudomonadota bacterium]
TGEGAGMTGEDAGMTGEDAGMGASKKPSFPRMRESRVLTPLDSRIRGNDESGVIRGARMTGGGSEMLWMWRLFTETS